MEVPITPTAFEDLRATQSLGEMPSTGDLSTNNSINLRIRRQISRGGREHSVVAHVGRRHAARVEGVGYEALRNTLVEMELQIAAPLVDMALVVQMCDLFWSQIVSWIAHPANAIPLRNSERHAIIDATDSFIDLIDNAAMSASEMSWLPMALPKEQKTQIIHGMGKLMETIEVTLTKSNHSRLSKITRRVAAVASRVGRTTDAMIQVLCAMAGLHVGYFVLLGARALTCWASIVALAVPLGAFDLLLCFVTLQRRPMLPFQPTVFDALLVTAPIVAAAILFGCAASVAATELGAAIALTLSLAIAAWSAVDSMLLKLPSLPLLIALIGGLTLGSAKETWTPLAAGLATVAPLLLFAVSAVHPPRVCHFPRDPLGIVNPTIRRVFRPDTSIDVFSAGPSTPRGPSQSLPQEHSSMMSAVHPGSVELTLSPMMHNGHAERLDTLMATIDADGARQSSTCDLAHLEATFHRAIVVVTVPSGVIVDCSPTFSELLGLQPQNIVNRTMGAFFRSKSPLFKPDGPQPCEAVNGLVGTFLLHMKPRSWAHIQCLFATDGYAVLVVTPEVSAIDVQWAAASLHSALSTLLRNSSRLLQLTAGDKSLPDAIAMLACYSERIVHSNKRAPTAAQSITILLKKAFVPDQTRTDADPVPSAQVSVPLNPEDRHSAPVAAAAAAGDGLSTHAVFVPPQWLRRLLEKSMLQALFVMVEEKSVIEFFQGLVALLETAELLDFDVSRTVVTVVIRHKVSSPALASVLAAHFREEADTMSAAAAAMTDSVSSHDATMTMSSDELQTFDGRPGSSIDGTAVSAASNNPLGSDVRAGSATAFVGARCRTEEFTDAETRKLRERAARLKALAERGNFVFTGVFNQTGDRLVSVRVEMPLAVRRTLIRETRGLSIAGNPSVLIFEPDTATAQLMAQYFGELGACTRILPNVKAVAQDKVHYYAAVIVPIKYFALSKPDNGERSLRKFFPTATIIASSEEGICRKRVFDEISPMIDFIISLRDVRAGRVNQRLLSEVRFRGQLAIRQHISGLRLTDDDYLNYHSLGLLGQGGQGLVYHVMVCGVHLALKIIRTGDTEKNRARLLEKFKEGTERPCVVHVYKVVHDDKQKHLLIFMELCTTYTLRHRLEYSPLGSAEASRLTRDILLGLADLHKNRQFAGDLKCMNLLFDRYGQLKLIDCLSEAKTILWVAPELRGKVLNPQPRVPSRNAMELLKRGSEDRIGDIWSLGIVQLEMMHGGNYVPFAGCASEMYAEDALRNLRDGGREFFVKHLMPRNTEGLITDEWIDFTMRCLTWDPERRPTAQDLLHDPFITNVVEQQRPATPPHAFTGGSNVTGPTRTRGPVAPAQLGDSVQWSEDQKGHAGLVMDASAPPIPLVAANSTGMLPGMMDPSAFDFDDALAPRDPDSSSFS